MITSINEFKQFNENNADQGVNLRTYDLKGLFKKINKECFNDELHDINIRISKSKSATGTYRRRVDRSTREITFEEIKLSEVFHMPEHKVKNVLCHEMIHMYVAHFHKNEVGHHGYNFRVHMDRINKMPNEYKITVKDDEPTSLNTTSVGKNKAKLFVYGMRMGRPKFILTHLKNYEPMNLKRVITAYKLTDVVVIKTTSPHTTPLSTSRGIDKVQELYPQYNHLLDNVLNDKEHLETIPGFTNENKINEDSGDTIYTFEIKDIENDGQESYLRGEIKRLLNKENIIFNPYMIDQGLVIDDLTRDEIENLVTNISELDNWVFDHRGINKETQEYTEFVSL